jgi:Cu(I)/Ag(I) efflux system membrane protein CusA/SilA
LKVLHILVASFALVTLGDTFAQNMKPPGKAAASASAVAMPLVEAEVRKVDLGKGLVVLRHGDIPNLAMPPMTMGFDVADKKILDGLKVGDKVKFQAEMVNGKATVTELKR